MEARWEPESIYPSDPHYPAGLRGSTEFEPPKHVTALGNPEILASDFLALFCSVKCPGSLILKAHDLAQCLQSAGVPVIGGFHSPIEQECLTILLRGHGPIIVCPARSLKGMRVRAELKKPLDEGRLLFLSSLADHQKRATVETAQSRNGLVTALAQRVFVVFADAGGKTEALCQETIDQGKMVYTFESEHTGNLVAMGVKPLKLEEAESEHLLMMITR